MSSPVVVLCIAFDRVLVRPRGTIFQVLSSRIELTRIGRMLQALVMFIYVIPNSKINWTWDKVVVLIFMIVGGIFVFAGFFYLCKLMLFYTRRIGI